MIGYCLGDPELIEWALSDPGQHGPSRGGFYPVMDTMIRDEHFWAEAPIYALHYVCEAHELPWLCVPNPGRIFAFTT